MIQPPTRIAVFMKRLFTALGAVTLVALTPVLAQATQPSIDDDTARSLRALIDEQIADDEPGYAVGVVIDDTIAFTHYAGLALLDTPTPIAPRTRFNIASVAKQYTALMVLDLAASGQIDLSEDFRTYLPDAMARVEDEVTIAQLITHTAGVRDAGDLFAITNENWYEYDFNNRFVRRLLDRQTAVNFEPGTEYEYSNSNYHLLADLVAAVSGQSFPDYANAFFAARGMNDTMVRRTYGTIVPYMARAYGNWSGNWAQNSDIANTYGDGFIFTTLPDQLIWETQIWGHNQTLPAGTIAESQSTVEGVDYDGYGYGLVLSRYRGLQIVSHNGSTGGYNAHTRRFPEHRVSIVTMGNTNGVDPQGLANQIADLILEGRFNDTEQVYPSGPEGVGPFDGFEPYLGLYVLEGNLSFRLTTRQGELYREIEGRDPVRMVYETANIFHYETIPELRLVLTRGEDGVPQMALYSASQPPQFGRWVEEAPEGDAYRESLQGRYFNEETYTEIILRHDGGDSFTMIKNRRPRGIELVRRDGLSGRGYDVDILRDAEGRITAMRADRGAARNMIFTRTE